MSSVLGVTKSLMWDKFKLVNVILIFDLLVSLTYFLTRTFFGSIPYLESLGVVILILVATVGCGLIFLTLKNETILVSNRYRLIPLESEKLYLSNFLTTGFAYLYLGVVEVSLFCLKLLPKYRVAELFDHLFNYEMLISEFLLALAVILIWTLSSSIHLLSNVLSNFLPRKRRKLIAVVVYVVVAIVAYEIFDQTLTITSRLSMYHYMQVNNTLFRKSILLDLGGIISGTILNLYLLKNYGETRK